MKPLPQTNPEKAGLNSELLEKAIQFAIDNESSMNRDIGAALEQGHFEEPWPIGKTIGPVKNRKAGSGVILRHGEVVQTWGDGVERSLFILSNNHSSTELDNISSLAHR